MGPSRGRLTEATSFAVNVKSEAERGVEVSVPNGASLVTISDRKPTNAGVKPGLNTSARHVFEVTRAIPIAKQAAGSRQAKKTKVR